ncbi:DUF4043 domain-containing protein [Glaciimonas sp. PCH181]|uniref:DUF4043 domain-containing protein n=1 Tax=Glaciimonas sp. PCH181 TaxID=2133943 RepID=UPI000D3571F6|nr:DUF4043 domain-containing protein [Glaciimonas sp. PCH181]PUA19589.1 DUF4043 domain-containing protein [Glaciimonas sp. PCH181]
MGIQAFPASLVPIIQTNMLEREFQDALQSVTAFRSIADREEFSIGIGETITKTRRGLKAPVTTPLTPSTNTNLDNGLTPAGWTVEQYSLALNMYADTIDLNMVTSRVGLASQFLQNANVNGVQAGQSLDRIARNTLFNAHLGGNTRVRTTLGAPGTALTVDDIRGFQNVFVNGVLVPVSAGAPMTVTVGSNSYTLQTAVADGSNVSTAPNGVSGVLNFSGNVTVADGTALNAVVSAVAPSILRAGGRSTTAGLVGTDLLTMGLCLDAVAQLRNNNVPTIDGLYNCYLDNKSARQLFTDPDFKLLFQGANASEAFRTGRVVELLDLRFIPTTEAYQQTLGAVNVKRPIVCGKGALIEGDFAATGYSDVATENALMQMVDGIAMVTREPLDRLAQIIAQSWYWIGGFCVPTDLTANTTIIPTANNSYYKRAIVLETA